jgi:hypothetical protein
LTFTWLLTVLGLLPVCAEDRADENKGAQLVMVADSIRHASTYKRWPGTRRELALLLFTVGHHESAFSMRIGRGEYRKGESDPDRNGVARAHSFYQLHLAATSTKDRWEAARTDIYVSAEEAARALTRARYLCAKPGEDWVAGTISAFAGRRCDAKWAGLGERVATYRRLAR